MILVTFSGEMFIADKHCRGVGCLRPTHGPQPQHSSVTIPGEGMEPRGRLALKESTRTAHRDMYNIKRNKEKC